MKKMICPLCRVPLGLDRRFHTACHPCPKCRGVWFNAAELHRLAAKLRQLDAWMKTFKPAQLEPGHPLRQGVRCPRCVETPLDARLSRGVELDVCPECGGTWFDAGELKALARIRKHHHVRFRSIARKLTAEMWNEQARPVDIHHRAVFIDGPIVLAREFINKYRKPVDPRVNPHKASRRPKR